MVEQLAGQLSQLARQARQAARYRDIGDALRRTEGVLLYRRWRVAEDARQTTAEALRSQMAVAAEAEKAVRQATVARQKAEEALPPLREEEAIAIVQRLGVQRDTLSDQENRARAAIDALTKRIAQLTRDLDREGELNRDAEETIMRLEREERDLSDAGEGHEAAVAEAAERAKEAAGVLASQLCRTFAERSPQNASTIGSGSG